MDSIKTSTSSSWLFSVVLLLFTLLIILCLHNKRMRFHANVYIYYCLASIIALLTLPLFIMRPFNVKNGIIAGAFGKHITKVLGISWELRNGEILAEDRGCVIIANHQNFLDSLGMYNIWAVVGNIVAVVKKQYFYVWPLGLSMWLSGTIFIDRQNPQSAIEELKKAVLLMKKKKAKIWIFPEGTYNKTGDAFMPFKKGAFRIAISSQVPIIPVVYSPCYFIDNKKKEFAFYGKMVITALPPISTEGLTMNDLDQLIATTRTEMLKSYNAVAKEVTASLE